MSAEVAVEESGAATRPDSPRWLAGACVAASAVVIGAVAGVAAVHLGDRYAVDHASGARIALARSAAHGVLYPPLVDTDSFGGTRFMPLPVLLHAGMSRVTGEYLVSGKLLSLATMIAIAAVMWRLLRGSGCPVPLSAGLVAAVVASQTGLLAATGLRGDGLPLLLQLLAVAVAGSSTSRRATWVAAMLAALAVTAKLHALWAPLAIAAWLWAAHDRRRLRDFIGAFVGLTALLLALLTAMTGGRLIENVFGLSGAGLGPGSVLSSPYRLLHLLVDETPGLWLLLPAALAVAWAALRRRCPDPWQLSLVAALLILLVVLGDIGTGGNQLIDATVLTGIVLGRAAGMRPGWWSVPAGLYRTALTAAVTWVLVTGLAVTLFPAARDAVGTLRDPSRYRAQPLAGVADNTATVLSEDPYVPVSLGQDPVVLDPFMFLRIARRDPAAGQALVRRIEAREFDLVVLVEPLDDAAWWADYHFGTPVIAAVRRSYVFAQRVQGYDVYRPRPSD